MKLRIGTRGSDLALWQARWVAARLAPEVETEIVVLKTRGDTIDQVPLQTVEGKAFFTAEIEQALLAGDVDLAVHSHKDLPTEMVPGLVIAAIPERASQRERLLVRREAHDPSQAFLPVARGAIVGTSSPRRDEQLRALRPDLQIAALRGNVPTRVDKLRKDCYGAIVLAAAGLDRLGLELTDLVDVTLPLEWFVPAPAQGALAVQIRASDGALRDLLRLVLHDLEVERAVAAERMLLERAGGGCNLPLGAAVTGSGPYHAFVFLGADRPRAGLAPRWARASGDTPEQAAERAFARVAAGAPTHEGPLAGLSIALCGSAAGPSDIGDRLLLLGARVVHERVIEFEDLDRGDLAARCASLAPGDAIAITSRQAAARLAGIARPPQAVVGAVGRASARELERIGWRADVVGEGGARELAAILQLAPGARVLFPCAEAALGELEDALLPRGIRVERVELYRTCTVRGALLACDVDARVYLSPSAARAALELGDPAQSAARRFALGISTQRALEESGRPAEGAFHPSADVEELVRLLARVPTTRETVS